MLSPKAEWSFLHWWTKSYIPQPTWRICQDVFELAVKHRQLNVLQLLDEHANIPDNLCLLMEPCDLLKTAQWLHERLKFSIRLDSSQGKLTLSL